MSQIVNLSVGGMTYQTTLEVLNRAEYFKHGGPYGSTIFVDRDGVLFRYVLAYLREPRTVLPVDDKPLLENLFLEAEFFGIAGLKSLIGIYLSKYESHPVIELVVSRGSVISTSIGGHIGHLSKLIERNTFNGWTVNRALHSIQAVADLVGYELKSQIVVEDSLILFFSSTARSFVSNRRLLMARQTMSELSFPLTDQQKKIFRDDEERLNAMSKNW